MVDIDAKNERKQFEIVREALVQSEGVLPSDAEVTAVLECIKEGKNELAPKNFRK